MVFFCQRKIVNFNTNSSHNAIPYDLTISAPLTLTYSWLKQAHYCCHGLFKIMYLLLQLTWEKAAWVGNIFVHGAKVVPFQSPELRVSLSALAKQRVRHFRAKGLHLLCVLSLTWIVFYEYWSLPHYYKTQEFIISSWI